MQKVLFGGETWHWSQHIRNSSNCFCKRAVTHNNGAKGKKKDTVETKKQLVSFQTYYSRIWDLSCRLMRDQLGEPDAMGGTFQGKRCS